MVGRDEEILLYAMAENVHRPEIIVVDVGRGSRFSCYGAYSSAGGRMSR